MILRIISSFLTILFLIIFFLSRIETSQAETWIRAGYWYSGSEFPVAAINSGLFTHLLCAFASVNSSTHELSISSSDEQSFSTFTETVQQRNPKITTLLSVGGGTTDPKIFSDMAKTRPGRKSFVDSAIATARVHGFHGLDLMWVPETVPDMTGLETLIREWRAATEAEAKNMSRPRLILTEAVERRPIVYSAPYPVITMAENLDWINVMAYEYDSPGNQNRTGGNAVLYDPTGDSNTDDGIKKWIGSGFPANKLVLGFPYHGYAWELANPREGYIGAEAKGPSISEDGSMRYTDIKDFMRRNGVYNESVYNATYVVNYVTVGSTWIAFDDVEAVRTKVSYAMETKLLGYYAWQVSSDDNWVLSQAAHGINVNDHSKRRTKILISTISATIMLVIVIAGSIFYYLRKRMVRSTAKEILDNSYTNELNHLQVFSLSDIEEATNGFASENKLGEGGFGPVYKGTLRNGMDIAVKKLSKNSNQGFEEFKNEVSLTAKLQHVNLVRVLGYCTQRDEQMLVYDYMPNKSLDFFLFDESQRVLVDWGRRVHIIEGVTQGLLYLQEYSRLTIIHRDLKASNILLDENMNARISDFGMAKIFAKDQLKHENTDRIAGTFGYAPPEYLKNGLYSTKSDVYSFGILLLQIISGKKNAYLYGLNKKMHLLDFGYEMWKQGIEWEFMDSSLNDSVSTMKLNRCLQIGLLCVQENANDRPSMLEISSMLKNETTTLPAPKKPAFSNRTSSGNQQNTPSQLPERQSVNTMTVSMLHGR